MTVRTTKMGGTDFAAGDPIASADHNDTFAQAYSSPEVVYTGTGFNCSVSSTSDVTDTHNTTLTVAANKIKKYVRIDMCIIAGAFGASSASQASSSITIETSVASAASWTSRLSKTIVGRQASSNSNFKTAMTITFYYEPTASEKSTGLDIRITGASSTSGGSDSKSAMIENIQTVVYAN